MRSEEERSEAKRSKAKQSKAKQSKGKQSEAKLEKHSPHCRVHAHPSLAMIPGPWGAGDKQEAPTRERVEASRERLFMAPRRAQARRHLPTVAST